MPRSYRLARLVSDLLSPPVVALVVFWVLAEGTGHSSRWPTFLTCVATQSFFPLAFLSVAVRNGSLGDVNMSRREERRFGLLALGLVYMAGLALAVLLGVRGPVLFVCICTLAVIAVLWAVNLVYKASGHVAGLTAYMAAVSIFVQPLHAGLVLIPAVSWARVRTGAHTHFQVVSGAVLGAGVAIGFYYLTRSLILGT
jgi:membrane-associated phospholipid phosphatase